MIAFNGILQIFQFSSRVKSSLTMKHRSDMMIWTEYVCGVFINTKECPKFPIAVTASHHLSLERLFWEDRIQNFAVVKIKIIIPPSLINELHLGFKSDLYLVSF